MDQEKRLYAGQAPVRGRLTYTDLKRTQSFFLPWERDPWGRLRPPFSQEMMRLSLELAYTAYDLRIGDWMQAGWTDFNFQVDNKLVGGVSQAPLRETKQFLYNKWAVYRARASARQLNPVSQVLSAMRQREQSDTGKAVVMIKPAEAGRFVVAIGFRGTGTRFYDWFSNFRFSSEQGLHQGFLQLARQFDENLERIAFPETAKALGLEKLTLSYIITEAKRHDSRFRLWMSGHSQGAAVMQVLTHMLINDSGVLPENLVGYGFASPMTVMGGVKVDPAAYPLYHVLNSDDYVARSGAQMHLGVCLYYPAGEAVRKAAYGWRETEKAQSARAALRFLTRSVNDMPALIEYGMAYLQALSQMPVQEMVNAMSVMRLRILPLKQILAVTGTSQESMLSYARRRVEKAYVTITGHGLDQGRLDGLQAEIEAVMKGTGAAEFGQALSEMLLCPHTLRGGTGKRYTPYQYIALKGAAALHPAIWQNGAKPRLKWVSHEMEPGLTAPPSVSAELPAAAGLYNRRRPMVSRSVIPRRHQGFSSLRR